MRGLELGLGDNCASDTLLRLSSNSPGGLLFPKLESLTWDIYPTRSALPLFHLFLSPRLRRVILIANFPKTQGHLLIPLAQMISALPTSVERLSLMYGKGEEEPLKDALSSFVCQHGSSLKVFGACVPLSEPAIGHLAQLPNLSYCGIFQQPPHVVPTSIFPSLEDVWLGRSEALPWLPLLASHERDVLWNSSTSTTSYTNIRDSLKSLGLASTIVDSTFLSSVVKFQNLVTLAIYSIDCSGELSCAFHLTDGDVENLASSIPRLKTLQLGSPCWFNSCDATVASLVSISVHCLDLTVLETHFNTRTIVSDMQQLIDGGAERDTAKCKLRGLAVGRLPLEVNEENIEAVAMGFKVIFPCLKDFEGYSGILRDDWHKVESKLGNLRR